MVELKGVEPNKSLERSEHSQRRNQENHGQNQGLALENRTEMELVQSELEPTKTITEYITGYITDEGLQAVVNAWPNLPQEAKHSIAIILESEKKKRS
jgi:hypothetical protein